MIQLLLVTLGYALVVGFLLAAGVQPWHWRLSRGQHLAAQWGQPAPAGLLLDFEPPPRPLVEQVRSAAPGLGRAGPSSSAGRREGVETLRARGEFPITRAMLDLLPRKLRGSGCEPDCLDSGEVFVPVELDGLSPEYHAVGWKPSIKKHRCLDGSAVEWVHHINLVRVKEIATFEKKYYMRKHAGSSISFVASYDRGAGEYWLPEGYGIPFDGSHLGMFIHVLRPKCWDFSIQAVELSGFDLYFTRKPPGQPATFVAFLDAYMRIQRRPGAVHYVSELDAAHQQNMFKAASRTSGSGEPAIPRPRILAVHLHTHAEFDTKYFEVYNPNGTLLFRSPEETCGYGLVEQSMENVGLERAVNPQDESKMDWPVIEVVPGQVMRQHCKKKDMGHFEDRELVYGLSWGEEMCAPLLLVGGPGLDIGGGTFISMTNGYEEPRVPIRHPGLVRGAHPLWHDVKPP